MKPKIWISTGGTGGHLFPALAFADEIMQRLPTAELFFLGGGLESSRYFDARRYACVDIPCGSFVKKNPKALLTSAYAIGKGVLMSHQLMRQQQPDLLVGFGSFFSFPPLVGAKLAGTRLMLHAADALPGRVLRLMSRYAELTVLQFAEASRHLSGPTAVARMPLRVGMRRGVVTREEAHAALGLDPKRRTLLVFGGSQGARRLNQVVREALLRGKFDVQLIHYTGDAVLAEQLTEVYRQQGLVACVKPFETRMELAWSAADLAIARAGASTIAEIVEFEVPAILVPYPYAKDQHQDKNADVLAQRIQGAVKIPESQLTPDGLIEQLGVMLEGGGCRMREALARARLSAPRTSLADLVVERLGVS